MESSAAAAEKDGIRVTARKPATTPPTFLHVTRNLLSFARSQASGTDHELALSLLWRPAISLGAGAAHQRLAAIDATQARKRLRERGDPSLDHGNVFVAYHEHADAPHTLALLRPRRGRPRCRAPEHPR